MNTQINRILDLINQQPGMTDREITDRLSGPGQPQQSVNQACRKLAADGVIRRIRRSDGLIGNYPTGTQDIQKPETKPPTEQYMEDELSEDNIKRHLKAWLISNGWKVSVAWGHAQGINIDARKGSQRWVIEVKGIGSRQPMRVNYFLGILGETLQRMDDPDARYSIALPDVPQYRGLWNRLPRLAKQRTMISALFVDSKGSVVLDGEVT